jgi:hypothetical protein
MKANLVLKLSDNAVSDAPIHVNWDRVPTLGEIINFPGKIRYQVLDIETSMLPDPFSSDDPSYKHDLYDPQTTILTCLRIVEFERRKG